ncbi:MAG: hypothetical protein IT366_23150 [Candidatus Hydrogenedentes bacterium]|nr:hypothetical protein [Candidatus Hydrogenedentota bacterium]
MLHTMYLALAVAMSTTAAPSITITIKSEDGSALTHTPIVQFELERYNIAVQPVGQTDEHGKLSLTFDDRESTKDGDRGYGVYRFLAAPKDRPWALSDLYVWYPDPKKCAVYLDPTFPSFYNADNSNWQYGKRVALKDSDNIEWRVTLPEKRDLTISIYDDWGLPIRNSKIRVFVDMCVLSHTGLGGEYSFGDFTTDSDGRFTLPSAGDFFYSFDCIGGTDSAGQNNGYIAPDAYSYVSTVRCRLISEGQTLVYHRLVNLPLKFTVNDGATGSPIASATVSQVIQFSSAAQGGPIGNTDEHGRFHTDTFHPEHTVEFVVTAEGYAEKRVEYVPNLVEYTVALDPKAAE